MKYMKRAALIVGCGAVLSACAALDENRTGVTGPASRPPVEDAAPAAAHSPSMPATPVAPPSPAFIEERARQAYETGRWDVAEGYYLQLTRLKPKEAGPWFQLGNLYAEQGRLDSAERAYREALRRHDDARTLHNLGLVQVRLGVSALRESQKRLPANDPARQETREFLQALLDAAAQ
ncbi:MAG: tetratricopeptide repeat protein [Candidatus Competibacteraceae bacterium]|nr:MAG: tetratricopeptide repeat protein [Candidatus Competibacteraceae bacterium]